MASNPNASSAPFPVTEASDPPMGSPDAPHDGAPAGPWLTEGELPSVPVLGGQPMTTNGYSPDPSKPPQSFGNTDSGTAPLSGLRR